MKFNREQLKELIKECLTEILVEGLGNSASLTENRDPIARMGMVAEAAQKRKRVLKTQRAPEINQNTNLRAAVEMESMGNPVLKDILADTAMTTLQEQNKYEGNARRHMPGTVEDMIADVEPEKIFGEENANKWAQLAFMDDRPKLHNKKSS